MKTLVCKASLILAFVLFLGTTVQAKEVKKEFQKDFPISTKAILEFETKFTELTIKDWDQNKVHFAVEITANHQDEEKAKQILDMITVDIEADGDKILLETGLDEALGKKESLKNNTFSIKVVVSVPRNSDLSLETKFGSAQIGNLSGAISIENDFGSLEASSLSGAEIEIEINHGDGQIGELASATVSVGFGSLRIGQAQELSAEVNAGELSIGSVGNLEVEVDKGELVVTQLLPGFEEVTIEVNMGNVELGVDKDAGFTLFGEMKMGNIDLPKGKDFSQKTDKMNKEVKGSYGSGNAKIHLEGAMSNIELKIK